MRKSLKIPVGETFGRLTVIGDEEKERKVFCKCICGNEKWIDKYSLNTGKTKSCGCLNSEMSSKKFTKHGESNKNNRLYKIWSGMKSRCNTVNTPYYINYGGRGITVCDTWMNDFIEFEKWAIHNGYSDSLTIDRIDNDGNYEPDNCRWVSKQEQDKNKRTNIFFLMDGEKITMKELSRRTGIPDNTLHYRYHRNGKKTYEEIIKPIRG